MKIRTVLGVAAALCTAGMAAAQPANDTCGANTASFTIPGTGGLVTQSVTGWTRDGAACTGSTGADVYYYFTPASAGPWKIDTCTNGNFDSVLSIHNNTCPVSASNYANGQSSAVCCSDDVSGCGAGASSRLASVPLTAGTTYIIRVGAFSGTAAATFTLTVTNLGATGACCSGTGVCSVVAQTSCSSPSFFQGNASCTPDPCAALLGACCAGNGTCSITTAVGCASGSTFQTAGSSCTPNPCPQPPANDECPGELLLASGGNATVAGSTLAASTTAGATSGCGSTPIADVWYEFVPDVTTNYTASLCASSPAWDSVLSVHTACPGLSTNLVAATACNDDGCVSGIGLSAITTPFALTAGTHYWVRVAGYPTIFTPPGANRGNFILSISGAPLGRCCSADLATCNVTTQAACTGTNTWTSGSTCSGGCPAPSGQCCAANGGCTVTTQASCTGTWNGAVTTCTPNTCTQPSGSCCATDGSCTVVNGVGACTGTFTVAGTCTPNPCPQPLPNDTCPTATSVGLGTPAVVGDNSTAQSGESVTCQASLSKGVWYKFTAPSAGTYQFDTEGSAQTDTVLALFDSCTTQLACDDDGGTGNLSLIQYTLTASQTVQVMVGSFGTAATGGGFNLNISQIITGACCSSTGACTITTSAGCTGTYQNDNTVCTPNPCPPSGACCIASCCTVTLQAGCTGTWASGGTCTPSPCGVPANDDCANAIAISNATLPVTVSGNNCGATTDGIAGSCTTGTANSVWWSFTPAYTGAYTINTCGSAFDSALVVFSGDCVTPVQVACNDDSCGLQSQVSGVLLSAGQTYLVRVASFSTGVGTISLTVSADNALGSCCAADGTCTQTDSANCASGTFNAGGTCSPNACPQPNGACCCGSNCSITAPGACTGSGRSFAGSGTSCTPFSSTVPCCRGDFNKTGTVSVQDIFDFLAGYFSNSPCADTNDTGTVSVQDIFDFLAAYFGGC